MYMQAPPDTSGYMIAGYIIAFTVMGIYLLSLFMRWRNLNRDLEALAALEKQAPPRAASSRKPPARSKQTRK
jgi:hypothetical protein